MNIRDQYGVEGLLYNWTKLALLDESTDFLFSSVVEKLRRETTLLQK